MLKFQFIECVNNATLKNSYITHLSALIMTFAKQTILNKCSTV